MTVVERNWRCKAGEIDIVALDGATLVLVEVKTRASTRRGRPEEAVGPTKQKRLGRVGSAYLQHAGIDPQSVRFDVVAIRPIADDRAVLRHYRNAFAVA